MTLKFGVQTAELMSYAIHAAEHVEHQSGKVYWGHQYDTCEAFFGEFIGLITYHTPRKPSEWHFKPIIRYELGVGTIEAT
jgi:hypothetical protein